LEAAGLRAAEYCRGRGLKAYKADGLKLPVDDRFGRRPTYRRSLTPRQGA
jgi:hypothetical protein